MFVSNTWNWQKLFLRHEVGFLDFYTRFFIQIIVDNNVHAKPKGVFFKGTIIGALITIPSLIAFFVSWMILEDEINALIIGMVVHFIGMGFSFKISKKLFKIKTQ